MNGRMVMGAVLLVLLGAGCATPSDFAVSAMARTDDVRFEVSRVKIDLAEILTP